MTRNELINRLMDVAATDRDGVNEMMLLVDDYIDDIFSAIIRSIMKNEGEARIKTEASVVLNAWRDAINDRSI